ncbi:UNVERIFIED_CONTAM: hypothetical protein Sangu_1555300 [Sesamum angustifolium]|uniref:RNase H type-1 domain-containing protein n=1 Tax=Sesamum angustifolium TaxID=2727405 RepID=A0AAW2MSF2_9LAMI
MKAPTNVNEVQRLSGRIAALSRFISKAAEKNLPFFKVLRKAKKFNWDTSCKQAFEELKKYLTGLPLLVKPFSGIPSTCTSQPPPKLLALFLFVKKGRSKCQFTISEVLNGAEGQYTPIEKMALALVISARRFLPLFLSHPIKVKTNVPLKQTLGKPDTSGRLVKRTVELSEYDILYLQCTTIKAQALANFMSEMAGAPTEDAPKVEKWLLHVDGSFPTQDSGAGVVITSPCGEDLEFDVKFVFKASNNEVEYEALVIGMGMAHEVGARHLVAYSNSQLIVKQVEGTYAVIHLVSSAINCC